MSHNGHSDLSSRHRIDVRRVPRSFVSVTLAVSLALPSGAAFAAPTATGHRSVASAVGVPGTGFEAQVAAAPGGETTPDVTKPVISNVEATDGADEALDLDTAKDHVLPVKSTGLTVRARIVDPQPASAVGQPVQEVSGVDADGIKLRVPVGGDEVVEIAPDEVKDGTALFTLTMAAIGVGGLYDLSDITLAATDEAGNTATFALQQAQPFKGSDVNAFDIARRITLGQAEATIPYGVNVNDWLSAAPLFRDEDGITPVDAAAFTSTFAEGQLPFWQVGEAYPEPGASVVASWGAQTSAGAKSVILPDLSGLTLTMAATDADEVGDGNALPLVPREVLEPLVSDADGAAAWRVGQDDAGNSLVWLNKGDADEGSKVTLSTSSDVLQLSVAYSVAAGGSFVQPADTKGLSLEHAGQVYAKLAHAGQPDDGAVARIPVALDDAAPTITNLAATWSDGSEITEDTSWVDNGQLYVPDAGLKVTAQVAEPADGTPSGLDADSLALHIGDKTVAPDSFEDGTATFTLSKDVLGGFGVYALADMTIAVRDKAHNQASESLTGASPFAALGATSLEVLDEASQAHRPEVALDVLNGTTGAALTPQDGTYYTNAADGADVRFRVSDARFAQLLKKDRWLASNPITWKSEGTYPSSANLDPKSFSAVEDTGWYQSSQLGQLDGEGTYNLTYHYTGASMFFFWNLEAQATARVMVDRTSPVVSDAKLPAGYDAATELAKPEGTQPGSYVLIGSARTFTVNIADLSATAADGSSLDAASGLANGAVTITRHSKLDGSDAGTVQTVPLTANDFARGTVSITLADDGVYRLQDIGIELTDKAGNTNTTGRTLADVVAALPESERGAWSFNTVVVDSSVPHSGVDVTSQVNATNRAGLTVHGNDAAAVLWISDEPWAQLYAHTDAFAKGISTSFEPGRAGEPDPQWSVSDLAFNTQANRWEIPVALSHAAGAHEPSDGQYTLKFAYRTADDNPADNEQTFLVDSQAPQVTDQRVEGNQDPSYDVAQVDGKTVLVGGVRTLKVRVQDLLPDSDGEVAARDERYASGVNGEPASVQVSMVRADGMGADAAKTTVTKTITVGDDGWATIPLDEEGLYALADMNVTMTDYGTNARTVNVGAAIPAYDSILVDKGEAPRSLTAQVVDAEGTPASEDPAGYYHRGSIDVQVAIEDPWFAAYQAIPKRHDAFFHLTGTADTGQPVGAADIPSFTPENFGFDAQRGVWTATYQLRAQGNNRPVEGTYDLAMDYEGISGSTDRTRYQAKFAIDYSAPLFGQLQLSATSPVQWNWVFPHDEETVSVGVTDNLSGVNASTAYLTREGKETPQPTYANDALSATFTEDADRMVFDQTSAGVRDVAGNQATIPSFAGYSPTNFPEKSVAFSVDDYAPEIAVAWDNNDVRNGRYYNANRTATVTVTEANFDLLRANDERRVIATATCDGVPTELLAKDFENPSGDNKTWVATFAFDRDGDWTFDTGFTDAAGRASNTTHDEFTVDTTAPLLMVTFDNNEAANGMYYKAVRTATVDVTERNFSADLTPITTTAADGAAPGGQGWADGDNYKHTSQVFFGNETHYTMRVECTDLAGNTAEAFEEPEFVIDLTAPKVQIGGVQDHTAYADAAAPTVSYSDTNFDPIMADWQLKGAAQGDAFPLGVTEQDGDTTKEVTMPDFPHELKWDDVYTLTAKVTDKAGNEASDALTFSVNRFGSNYVLSPTSSSIEGAFMAKPQDVQVSEINVSGLDTQGSHAEVVHDSRVQSLAANGDYTVQPADVGGWSETTYTFPAKLFGDDGYYRILLTSKDKAGNLSQNSMEGKNEHRDGTADIGFAVDGTEPTSDVIGVQSGAVYLRPSMDVGIDGRDNLAVDQAKLSVDGQEVASWDADQLGSGYTSYTVAADGRPHQITLETTDRAGNTAKATYDNVVVAGDWIAYIRNTPALLYGSIAGGIGVVAAAAIGAVMFARHRRNTAQQRNPFGH